MQSRMGGKAVGLNRRHGILWRMLIFSTPYLCLFVLCWLIPGQALLERLRWLDSGICAHLPTHLLYAGTEALPLCARDTGIYLGLCVSFAGLVLSGRGRAQQYPSRWLRLFLGGGVLALIIDGCNSLALDLHFPHLYTPNNLLRLGTGLLTGLAIAVFLLPTLNQMVWKYYHDSRSLASWRALLGVFLPILLLCFGSIATHIPLTGDIIAILSTLGLLLAVGSLNMMGILLTRRRCETFTAYRQLLPLLGPVLLLTVSELLLLAQAKLWLLQALGLHIH
ncbi:DUF2085 domain-containing protein [Ktedonobacter sp. SOSP1-85]|uniref:DUF2085 domain-containing protein n=1 Tax=Ktedonobacter sp. SOSP1-85 TaxID=2778367 RepID=UPI0019156D78|nr:DUF2085 domain-containing protein [Ktedonobacter sp. SOSP1-85]